LLAIWHYPPLFDYAVLHKNVHILQHISFIIVGATGFIALRTLGESFRIITLITLNATMAFVGSLFAVTTDPVYTVYSINGHNEAGNYMLITCILLLLIGLPAYLIHRAFFHLRLRLKEQNIRDGKND
jgi:cytochrome c oxidase assembly factor CtaG